MSSGRKREPTCQLSNLRHDFRIHRGALAEFQMRQQGEVLQASYGLCLLQGESVQLQLPAYALHILESARKPSE